MSLAAIVLALSATGCAMQRPIAPAALPEPEAGQAVYDTEVRLELETASLDARSTLRYVANENTSGTVGFLLNRGLQLQGVEGVAVRSYRSIPFEPVPAWNLVEVELDETVAPGSTVALEVTYAGRPEFSDDKINGISPEWVELNLDSQWHPVFSTFDQELRGVLRVGLPPDWEVAASGSVSFGDSVHIIHNMVPQVDVAFAAAPALAKTSSENFTVYYRMSGSQTASAVLEAAEGCARYLNLQYGTRDPLPPGTLVLADRQGPGYARKSYIVLSQVNPDDQVGLHGFLCHELAHYWTHSAGAFSPHHWMVEAFAEYVAGRYLREYFGQTAFDHLVAQWEEVGRTHGPVWTSESTQRPSFFVMYRRGPYLLSRLEERIGAERFERFLERYMSGDARTTPELLEHLKAVAGAEAEQWFREELARGPA